MAMSDQSLLTGTARANLLGLSKQQRYTLKELSFKLGRNPSYLAQYIHKGSPRELPEGARLALAQILGCPEGHLRDGEPSKHRIATHHLKDDLPPPPSGVSLPLIRETPGNLPRATLPLAALYDGASARSVAIALTRTHGLLQPRHLLICNPDDAARIGDLVVLIVNSQVQAIGILVSSDGYNADCVQDAQGVTTPVTEDSIWRVVAICTA